MLEVKVRPNSKQNLVEQIADNQFFVQTTAKPKNNEANRAVQALLADYLDIPKSKIWLKRGEGSKIKYFEIDE